LREKGRVFGQSSLGLLAKYDQNTRLLKTFQLSLFEAEPESLEILPQSGMTRNGKLWEQTTWAHHTGENESGLWPTPTQDSVNERTKEYSQGGTPLTMAVKKFPTPQTKDADFGAYSAETRIAGGHQVMLCNLVKDDSKSGQLNPQFVEWLMGYPIGWTDCED